MNTEDADVKKTVSVHATVLSKQIVKHLSLDKNDLTLYVLKAHLIVESQINDFLLVQYKSQEVFKRTNLRFLQRVNLFFSYFDISEPQIAEIYNGVIELNFLRNKMAHQLEVDGLDAAITAFIKKHGDNETIKGEPSLRNQLILTLAVICAGIKGCQLSHELSK